MYCEVTKYYRSHHELWNASFTINMIRAVPRMQTTLRHGMNSCASLGFYISTPPPAEWCTPPQSVAQPKGMPASCRIHRPISGCLQLASLSRHRPAILQSCWWDRRSEEGGTTYGGGVPAWLTCTLLPYLVKGFQLHTLCLVYI